MLEVFRFKYDNLPIRDLKLKCGPSLKSIHLIMYHNINKFEKIDGGIERMLDSLKSSVVTGFRIKSIRKKTWIMVEFTRNFIKEINGY